MEIMLKGSNMQSHASLSEKIHLSIYWLMNSIRKRPTFSIIMPTYNRASIIMESISSILEQSFKDFELIIIDDGSVDNTQQLIMEKMSSQIKKRIVKFYRLEKNTGASHARNIGLEKSRGEWICYVDSDNTIDKEFLQIFANAIEKEPADCYYAQFIYKSDGREGPSKPFDYELLKKGNYIDMGVFVHKKDLVNSHGRFDEKLNRLIDWDLILRYTYNTKVIYIP